LQIFAAANDPPGRQNLLTAGSELVRSDNRPWRLRCGPANVQVKEELFEGTGLLRLLDIAAYSQ